MIAALIRWSMFQPLPGARCHRHPRRVGACGPCNARRSMRCPTCRTCRSSSARSFRGRRPQVVEDQVTYPLDDARCCRCPCAKTVRGYSFFGDSFVYVLFEDGTDLYWARSRVLEYLNQVQATAAGGRERRARARRDRRRLDLRIRARRSHRAARPRPAARAAGLVSQVRAEDRAGRRRGGDASAAWFASIRSCSIPSVCARTDPAWPSDRRDPATPTRKPAARSIELGEAEYMVRARGYLQDRWRTSAASRSSPATAASPVRARRRRARADRSRDAPRHRRARRRRRSRRRHRRHALAARTRWQTIRARQGEARAAQARPAAGRRDRRRPTIARTLIERARTQPA